MSLILTLKPGIPKRYLLFVAGMVWTFAGGMLLFKGICIFKNYQDFLWLKITGSTIAGILFYLFLFSKISVKHIHRIFGLDNDRPCLFSFFNLKSYILMSVMITSGILLRKFEVISLNYLSVLYVTMGIPLSISAFRFYYYGLFFHKIK
jgi:hypothetical protein